jgi:hypothetical protein
MSSAQATKVAVSMTHHAHYTASLTLSVDRSAVCKIALAEQQDSQQEREVCVFELPATAREIALSGEFAHVQSEHPPTRGSRRFRIVDIAPVIRPLRDTSRPFGQRVRAFLQAKEALEKAHPALMDNVELETSEREKPEAVKAAEARLKFPLPPEHVSFLREFGGLTVRDRSDEASTVSAGGLDRASRQIIDIWEMSAKARKALTPSTIALLEASTMLYSWNDHGYGYSAIIYEPTLPGRPSACGQQPAYHRISADSMNEPLLLTKRDGKTCQTYTEVMALMFVNHILAGWEEQDPEIALIDRSAPATLQLFLEHAPHEDLFPLALQPLWHKFE